MLPARSTEETRKTIAEEVLQDGHVYIMEKTEENMKRRILYRFSTEDIGKEFSP